MGIIYGKNPVKEAIMSGKTINKIYTQGSTKELYDIIKLAKLLSVKNKMKYAEDLMEEEQLKRREKIIEENIPERKKLTREERFANKAQVNKEGYDEEDNISKLLDELENKNRKKQDKTIKRK